jgi:cell wall-associated NlpC family hydrolase
MSTIVKGWPLRSLVLVAALAAGGCASTGAVPRPFPVPGGAARKAPPAEGRPDAPTLPTLPSPNALVDTALALLGTPYRDGGSDPDGFDCSGFTQWVYARNGFALPRETREQFRRGVAIRPEDVVAGDLVFFTTVAPGASHVAIALDADRFVHAPSSRGVVRVERRSSAYWQRRFIGARRVVPAE